MALLAASAVFILMLGGTQQSDPIDVLVNQLQSESLEVRESASGELMQLAVADRAVEAALLAARDRTRDEEVRARLQEVLEKADFVRARTIRLAEGRRFMEAMGGTPLALAESPDGTEIVSAGPDRRIVIVRTSDLKTMQELGTSDKEIRFLTWGPNSRIAALMTDEFRILDARSGKTVACEKGVDEFWSATFSADGGSLFTAGLRGLHQWDSESGAQLKQLGTKPVNAVALSPDGKQVIALGSDYSLHRWDVASGEEGTTARGVPDYRFLMPCGIAIGPSGATVAQPFPAGHEAPMGVRIWDFTHNEAGTFRPDVSADVYRCFGRAGAAVFGYDARGEIRVFRWNDGGLVRTLPLLASEVLIGRDDEHLFLGSMGELLKIELSSGRTVARARVHRTVILHLAPHPDGLSVVSAGEDGVLRQWDVGSGLQIASVSTGLGVPRALVLSTNGRHAAVAFGPPMAGQFDLMDPAKCIRLELKPQGPTGTEVNWMSWRIEGGFITGNTRGRIQVYARDGREERAFGSIGGAFGYRYACTRDGKLVARSALIENTVEVWEVQTGVVAFRAGIDAAEALQFSPDGGRLYVAGGGGRLHAIDVATGIPRDMLSVEVRALQLAMDPSGRFITAVGQDGVVRLIHAATLREVARVSSERFAQVAFSADGRTLIVAQRTSAVSYVLAAERK